MNNKFKGKELEEIDQHHFIKKTEKKAVTKHIPIEEPFTTGSFKVGDNEFHINDITTHQPTSSYDPYTFKIETSYQSVLEAIENGKDTDLVAMPVGEVRKMQERINQLENAVIGKYSSKNMPEYDDYRIRYTNALKENAQIERMKLEHQTATQLKRIQIEKEIERMKSDKWKNLFESK